MAFKTTQTLGRQAIPNFAREATLIEGSRGFTLADDTELMPEVNTDYNVACLVFFRRAGIKTDNPAGVRNKNRTGQPIGVTYWSNNYIAGATMRFSLDKVTIPGGAEWFSVAWFRPPDGSQITPQVPLGGNFPPMEDMFRVRWGLSI